MYIWFLGVCLNYCVNGGLCYVEDGTGRPICICNPGFVGDKCELGLLFIRLYKKI